jgi:proteasome assembly chaperone (PAC2) family protein
MKQELNHPWMIALWPGMGHVAINAGYYMMAKLAMHLESELNARELFEVDRVEVDRGIIRCARLPRSRFFVWHDPKEERDLVVFLGEAQPPSGAYAYCRRIIDHAQALGVERVFTFAAMATQMQLDDESRVFGAATGEGILEECRELGLEVLEEGQISGLNGVLLGVAAERGLNGACLLGEMPHSFTQVPFPKASLAVLEAFGPLAGLSLDLTELEEE